MANVSLSGGDILIIVPPFAGIDRPSLGAHTLQACALKAGFIVDVFYANLLFAGHIGAKHYTALAYAPTWQLMGERLFAQAAYRHGKPALDAALANRLIAGGAAPEEIERLHEIAAGSAAWVEDVVKALPHYSIVGASTTFEQTAASIAFLNAIKQHHPDTLTLIGGANCEGAMADGIASLTPHVDYVFSGESETTFIRFLQAWRDGQPPAGRVFFGEPNRAMDELPCPNYTEYYQQRAAFIDPAEAETSSVWLPYESSRGCWWGQKHHCTFCGLNGSGMSFRQKSPQRIIDDLRTLGARHPNKRVTMADNIMPNSYFKTLLPRLAAELPGYEIFYEQKANLDLQKVMLLRQAGITSIQPGIEALSTPLLRLMDKGVSAAQNIALLRYALINGVNVQWNLLCGFPGDQITWYYETLKIMRLIPHLKPPSGIFPLTIDRFSPYFDRPDEYGITEIRPLASYFDVLPDSADAAAIAYHFEGVFESATYQHWDVIESLRQGVSTWQTRWCDPVVLNVTRAKKDVFALKDTRGLSDNPVYQFISAEQARVALVGLPAAQRDSALWQWGVQTGTAVEVDDQLVPLALADAPLMLEMESASGSSARAALIMPP